MLMKQVCGVAVVALVGMTLTGCGSKQPIIDPATVSRIEAAAGRAETAASKAETAARSAADASAKAEAAAAKAEGQFKRKMHK